MQPVDYTTLTALYTELRAEWLPARLEQVYQRDRHTLCLALRTLRQRGWLTLSWHPQAARLCVGDPPPRTPDTFTFSEQLRHQLNGLALVAIDAIAPWERALDLQFAHRPGEAALWHLYIEIMGRYSNVILTNRDNQIVTVAHQVSSQQSSLRPLQTGQPYEFPPALTDPAPALQEPRERWQDRVGLVPGAIKRNLLKTYRGLSSALVGELLREAELNPEQTTDRLTPADWQNLFQTWQRWLKTLEQGNFQPGWTEAGYTVLGWESIQPANSVQSLIHRYYSQQLNQQVFAQLHHQLGQKVGNLLTKLRSKAAGFQERLEQSDRADDYRERADLLMAYLHEWKPGMSGIVLPDFTTHTPITIPLSPEKNAIQNAQALYKQHQKLKRARSALEPLVQQVAIEMQYLEQVEATLNQLNRYETDDDLKALQEIRDELIQQGYLEDPEYRSRSDNSREDASHPYSYLSPNGLEVLVGRNNRQNDQLTFRTAGDYDLWLHTQEIPGSHVLLRLQPGVAPDESDLQFAADLAAFHSRARQSDQVPVVYTQPKFVFKPRGAKPGITIYKNEQIIWGKPARGQVAIRSGG